MEMLKCDKCGKLSTKLGTSKWVTLNIQVMSPGKKGVLRRNICEECGESIVEILPKDSVYATTLEETLANTLYEMVEEILQDKGIE